MSTVKLCKGQIQVTGTNRKLSAIDHTSACFQFLSLSVRDHGHSVNVNFVTENWHDT